MLQSGLRNLLLGSFASRASVPQFLSTERSYVKGGRLISMPLPLIMLDLFQLRDPFLPELKRPIIAARPFDEGAGP